MLKCRACLLLTVSLLLLLGVSTPGCSGVGWSRSMLAGSGGPMDPLALRDLGYNIRWSASLSPKQNGGIGSVVALDDVVAVVENEANIVTLLEADTGESRWKRAYALAYESLFKPHRFGDQLVLHTGKRAMLVSLVNGDLTERFELDEHTVADGVLTGSLLILGGVNGKLYALDLIAGYPRWAYALTARFLAAPVISNLDVFAVDANGVYAMITAVDGTLRWRNRVFGQVSATPTIHRGDVLVPSADRSLYALTRATGNDNWAFRAEQPLSQPVVSMGPDAYLPLPGKGLVSIEAGGNAIWTIDEQVTLIARTPAGLLGIAKNDLVLLDPANGSVLKRVNGGDLQAANPGPDGSLLIHTRSGRLLRLDPIR